MESTVVEVLEEAKGLVARGWIQYAQAHNAYGEGCFADDPGAVCWCLTGALRYALYKRSHVHIDPSNGVITEDLMLMRAAYERIGWGMGMGAEDTAGVALGDIEGILGEWNDDEHRTQAEVVAVIEAVLVKAREAAA